MAFHTHEYPLHIIGSAPYVKFLLVALGVVVGEVVGGWAVGSLSLITDAVGHAPIHVVAAVMALWNQATGSRRTVKENQVWGRRVRITIAILIALSGALIFREALHRITHPLGVIEGWTMFAIALLGLLANLFQARLLQGCRCEADTALRQDVRSDITMSVAIIVSAVAIGFGAPPVIDPVLSLLASLWIMWLAISLFRRPHRH